MPPRESRSGHPDCGSSSNRLMSIWRSKSRRPGMSEASLAAVGRWTLYGFGIQVAANVTSGVVRGFDSETILNLSVNAPFAITAGWCFVRARGEEHQRAFRRVCISLGSALYRWWLVMLPLVFAIVGAEVLFGSPITQIGVFGLVTWVCVTLVSTFLGRQPKPAPGG